VGAVDQDRLRVEQLALAGGGIAHVADRDRSRQVRQRLTVKDVGDVSHLARDPHLLQIRRSDTGALLAPMLERIEPEVCHVGRFGMSEDAENAAFVLEFIEHGIQATRWVKYRSIAVDHTRSASSTD
jgi:hypothetical protein